MRPDRSFVRLMLVASATLGVACSKLTAPPSPEPIGSDTPVTMATAPKEPHERQPHPSASGSTLRPRQPRDREAREREQVPSNVHVKIEDEVVGKGPELKPGDIAVVDYTGTLLDGTKFDSSHDRGKPFTTPIPGRLIRGWNEGIPGMRAGGKRRLTIPPELGYGAMPQPKIPANSTLVFEIELHEIKANPRPMPLPKGP